MIAATADFASGTVGLVVVLTPDDMRPGYVSPIALPERCERLLLVFGQTEEHGRELARIALNPLREHDLTSKRKGDA